MIEYNLLDGYTLIHEHMTINLSQIKMDPDTILLDYEATKNELIHLYQLGVRNIVDVTTMGMSRNPELVKQLSKETGIQILQSTGYYKEPFLPESFTHMTVEQIAQQMIDEIRKGIEETSIKASLIGEIGTSKNEMTTLEKKIFDAAIIAHLNTGAVISTHTTLGTYGLNQAQYLIERGVNPSSIIIGHMDLSHDIETIIQLIKLGVYVGFDTVGKNNYLNDSYRIEMIKLIEQLKLEDHILISMDITRLSGLKAHGGLGYSYLFETFMPMLKDAGVCQQTIDKIFKTNARKLFGMEGL